MKHLFLIIALIALSGCSAIQAKSVYNDLAGSPKLVDRAALFCGAGELLGIPDADKCTQVLSTLQDNKDVLSTVYDAADCVRTKAVNVQKCINAVDGLADVVERVK